MPNQGLDRGHTANLAANQVHDNLTVIGLGASYNISIGGAPAIAHVIGPGDADVYPINNAIVSITNTTPLAGLPNMRISW
ncbi:hypothetical protein [Nostoc sp.]|uniref:hypothetical protein n=1 Tax=Nostoc sp. TaxID=1180 RepID=UPI002FFCC5D4